MDINKIKELNNDKIIIAKVNLFANNNNNSLTQEVKEVKEILTKEQVLKEFDFSKVSFKKVRIYANSHIEMRITQKNIKKVIEFEINFIEMESDDPIRINLAGINYCYKYLKDNNKLLPLFNGEAIPMEVNGFKFRIIKKYKFILFNKKHGERIEYI
jgi:hypothetical protein